MAIGKTNALALLTNQDQPVPESPTTHKVIFIDPFGVVNEQWVEDGTNAIVPTPRVHDYLTFVEWNQSTENVTEDRVIGATYNTTDGKTYAKIRLTTISGLSPTLYLNKSDTSTLTVDWGDDTTTTFTNIGNFNTGAHNYSVAGDYVISMWISVGSGTYSFGNSNSSSIFVGGTIQNYKSTLLSLFIGNSVTSIVDCTFQNCYSLTSISIPNSVTSIGNYAFAYCYSLISISIPNSVTSIGISAFETCHSLTSISIPNSVTSIVGCTFQNCYSLISISIPNSVTSIGISAFQTCYSLTSISIPNSVTSISGYAFYYCYSLTSISIPNSVTSIGNYAFAYCYSLTSISIPNSVTSIGASAFNSCSSLTSVSISSLVTSIVNNAFAYCYSILKYKIYASTPPTVSNINAFTNINSICKIYVPDASLTAYKTATNWATYANYIYPLSDIGE